MSVELEMVLETVYIEDLLAVFVVNFPAGFGARYVLQEVSVQL